MKNKRFVALMAGAALVANMALFAIAYAATTDNSLGDVTVAAGGLQLVTAPQDVSFGTATIKPIGTGLTQVDFNYTSATADRLEFADLRDTGGPFTVNVSATQFARSGGTEKFAVGATTGAFRIALSSTFGGGDSFNTVTGDCNSGIAAETTLTTFVSEGAAVTLVNAVSSSNPNRFIVQCDTRPIVRIFVPEAQKPGTYRSTLTYTIS